MRSQEHAEHRVRVAAAEDVEAFKALIARTNLTPEGSVVDAIPSGEVGRVLLEVAELEDWTALESPLERAAGAVTDLDQLLSLAVNVSLPLVATDGDGLIVGALDGIAPGNVVGALRDQGWQLSAAALLFIRAAKISAIGVHPSAARTGVGTALLDEACRIYFTAGFHLVYGFVRRRDLAFLGDFYRRAGFEVGSERRAVTLNRGPTVDLGPNPDQQMFSLSRDEYLSEEVVG